MNKSACVLAADSAVTVSRWINGKQEQKYYKGANKIFNPSSTLPIGVMIYSNATLHEIPWEIIVKEYRERRGKEKFKYLENFSEDFLGFVEHNYTIFPEEERNRIMFDSMRKLIQLIVIISESLDDYKKAETDQERATVIEKTAKQFSDNPTTDTEGPTLSDAAKAEVTGFIDSNIGDILHEQVRLTSSLGLVDISTIRLALITSYFSFFYKTLGNTGLVVAGYGEDEYMPSKIEYEIGGISMSHLVYKKKDSRLITRENPGVIKAYATSQMIDNFTMGFSDDVFAVVNEAAKQALGDVFDTLSGNGGASQEMIAQKDEILDRVLSDFRRDWAYKAMEAHYEPLEGVIASLPIDEMTSLAETMISLESLKEKVTRPSESVGGPIDVAVVSKHDGFVWVKRKHYFPAELNPRFFARIRG